MHAPSPLALMIMLPIGALLVAFIVLTLRALWRVGSKQPKGD